MKFSRSNAYTIDIPIQVTNNWTILKFDPVDYISKNLSKEFMTFGPITSENLVLRSMQFWSIMQLRGVYISNSSFHLNSLPKDMYVKILDPSHPFSNLRILELGQSERKEEIQMEDNFDISHKPYRNKLENLDLLAEEIDRKSKQMRDENIYRKSKENFVNETMKKLENSLEQMKPHDRAYENLDIREANNEILKKNVIFIFDII